MATAQKSNEKSIWKVCSRGHKYRGSRCPYCWKRKNTKNLTKRAHNRSAT